ncbi:intercellular adhesion molecule 3 [Equus quagga]|uniref:intercellular adhesion molecule 3 n=1 Tax=Equus quagga TaxID=89248 RepID=UPI001EE1CF86|nr:intercellular adhesion molecule 3 [Equus quagga]XP_046541474.1 intercellular adhesion molecule 3 [Equus quagga]XP_046541475.1 intercellular adhesion molecule 3 [Equus quagga]
MMPSGPLPRVCWTSLLSLLLVCCLRPPGAQGQFSLRLEPQDLVVPEGGSISVNCSTDCPNAQHVTLETSLPKEPLSSGLGWAAFRLSNVTHDDREVLCSSFCNGLQISGSFGITVYRFPDLVELEPLPSWQPVGQNLTLSCQVAGGAPRDNLTVVLLRGEEELSRQPAVGEPALVNHMVEARREDHGANFSCRAELDLRSRGLGLFQNSSAPRQLRTYALPVGPLHLDVPRFLEVERLWLANCTLDGLFPASEAKIQLALGDQMLKSQVERHGDRITATANSTARAEQNGTQEIVCKVTLGDESRETRRNLTIYSFQGPILTLSAPSVAEGTIVTVTCTAGARVQVTLDGVPAEAPGQPVQLQLNATERDDRRSFICNTTLKVDGGILYRNESVQLRVLYGAKIDRAKCPQNFTWEEMTTHVLECQAWGNPDPELQCVKQASKVKVLAGTPFVVRLKHHGTYTCHANNSHGKDSVTVVVNVQARNPAVVPVLVVLAILGLITVSAALLYVFVLKKHSVSDIYYVNRGSTTCLPLRSRPADQRLGEESS